MKAEFVLDLLSPIKGLASGNVFTDVLLLDSMSYVSYSTLIMFPVGLIVLCDGLV